MYVTALCIYPLFRVVSSPSLSLYLASVRSASCHFLPLSISDLRIVFRRLGSVQFVAWSSDFFAEFGEKGGGGNKIDIFLPNIIDFNVLFYVPPNF